MSVLALAHPRLKTLTNSHDQKLEFVKTEEGMILGRREVRSERTTEKSSWILAAVLPLVRTPFYC